MWKIKQQKGHIKKSLTKKESTNKSYCFKIRKQKEVKMYSTEWKKMFAIHLSDKGEV